jgi:hypothetical protein
MERSIEPVEFHTCWTRFPLIADTFGSIVENWLDRHDFFGPGFHLYLGNRRQEQMYPEHRFASLVWGLESLNRRMSPEKVNAPLQDKITRILGQISRSRDQKWLADQLAHAHEPSLADRLSELFGTLPLNIDKKQMDAFTRHCAQRRNDVSHFGGMREPGSYNEFLSDIMKLNEALDYLYHAKLLQMTGIPDDQIRWLFLDGFKSYQLTKTLEAVGLTVKRTEKPSV